MKGVTSVYIPLDLREKVDEICKKTHKTMSVVIREALQEYIERFEEKEKMRKYIEENFGKDVDMKKVIRKLIMEMVEDVERRGKNE